MNNSSNRKVLHNVSNVSEPIFIYSRQRLTKELSLERNTRPRAYFFTLYWDQFNDFDGFSSFISNSGQISSTYFLFNSFIIQQKPKYQQFILSKQDKLPPILSTIQIIPIPISRPLQLLTQKSYLDSLIMSYFKYIHPVAPIFSIHSFNPEKASKLLLSAVYYGGFQFMQDKPPELVKYFNEYAERNIKLAIRLTSFQGAQTSFLYSFLMLLSGNLKLFKACEAHTIRLSYALGLHLNLNRLTPIQKYDRFQFFSTVSNFHNGFHGMGNLALNQLTEIGECSIELLKPEYQIPNSKCVFYFDTEDENIVYGVCINTCFGLYYIQACNLYNLSKFSEDSIQSEFDKFFDKSKKKFLECNMTFDFLLEQFPHLELTIQSYRFELILNYHPLNLEMYRILRYKVKKLIPSQISEMLDECINLFDSVIESEGKIQVTHNYPYTAGLNLISLYPITNSIQKTLIKQKLRELLDYLSRGPCVDKLSYLIIKKEYENIIKD
ncbi:hypothetical protein CONCODRAFT_2765 [Conidiobolus coronatus NRRL 28638]|uniref:Xylanolytic transcriptional activator regulatory domain-containing protein n=1 Tax=Conidiobolus coronatus (strain ATCC 28846 / CBS 209.66 / NRRL 28638) TaxID=796925 RepID=A0A137PGU4_CONC2|nr:hypothetical protein CONCODRAFT_2765 [Conidiobolus coronatus NRRL 28638]|eukprot:KXN74229.1 hypothetical protein CONCODRAFT_2765 [Conidiobolus coronatus NRRL 28638]